MRRVVPATAVACLAALAGAVPATAATFTVDDVADVAAAVPIDGGACDAAGPATCTLRAAIQEANASAAPDAIVLPDLGAPFGLSIAGQGEELAAEGDLDVRAPLTIAGAGAPAIDALGIDRVFHVGPPGSGGASLSLAGVEVRGGDGVARGGGIYAEGGPLALSQATISGNEADEPAGAAEGGGIFLEAASHSIAASTVAGNEARGQTAASGGGIAVAAGASLSALNSTISENTALASAGGAAGGGIASFGSASLVHVTADGNGAAGSAFSRGGTLFAGGGTIALRATIVSRGAGAAGEENCRAAGGSFSSQGSNLEAPASGSQCGLSGLAADRVGATAGLAPLAERGGPTPTQAPFTGSVALDAIPSCFPYTTDQRGEPRPGGPACEIGAYERQELPPPGAGCFGRPPTILGKPGVATIVGTPAADVILGSGRRERIDGGGGKDLICGGKGNDRIHGGPSRDRIAGGHGKDNLFGDGGKDQLLGNAGADRLDGGPEKDLLNGGGRRDFCRRSAADKLTGC